MVTLSSAFMSSRRARTMRRVSLALGRKGPDLETRSGVRRDARESAGLVRGCFPLRLLHPPLLAPGHDQDSYFARFFPLLLGFFLLAWPELLPPWRKARSAVEDSADLRPCRKAQAGGLRLGREMASGSAIRAWENAWLAGLAVA